MGEMIVTAEDARFWWKALETMEKSGRRRGAGYNNEI